MIDEVIRLSREAGKAVMHIYINENLSAINYKIDKSPVTQADLISHNIIFIGLQKLTPGIPIYSEENINSIDKLVTIDLFWLIDPLDGTKEFLSRNGEFTINIALIQHKQPIMGVIYAPFFNILYFADNGKSWKIDFNGNIFNINSKNMYPPVIVVSRSHYDGDRLCRYLNCIKEFSIFKIGSSLKFCMIAEGNAQYYPRFSPVYIWDIAAGHVIAKFAGAKVADWLGRDLNYTLHNLFITTGFQISYS